MSSALPSRLHQLQPAFLASGVLALLCSFIGAFFNTRQFFVSYLFAYLFWFGLAIGCILITMILHLTGGKWGHPVRRFLEAGFSTLPLLALLFIPLLFGLRYLYPWAQPDLVEKIDVLQKKRPYLNSVFYTIRVFIYFSIWIALAWRLRRWSLLQDRTTDPEPTRRLMKWSGPGVVIVPLTATFAYIDWIMSMEAKWFSTIFAVIVLAGQVLAAYSFAVILFKLFERQEPFASLVSRAHYHQLGNLLLTFVMFWTYVAFSQLLIIYSGNTPEEIGWYLHRIEGRWKDLAVAIFIFHFFFPFILLLFRAVKKRGGALAGLALVLLAIHLLYVFWLITPSVYHSGFHVSWMDFVTPIGLGGVWLTAFFWLLGRSGWVVENNPRLREEVALEQR